MALTAQTACFPTQGCLCAASPRPVAPKRRVVRPICCALPSEDVGADSGSKRCWPERRGLLLAWPLMTLAQQLTPAAFAGEESQEQATQVLYVCPRPANPPASIPKGYPVFSSISQALEATQQRSKGQNTVIRVAAGQYTDRLVIVQSRVVIEAYPQGAEVQVTWETREPYQAVIDCIGRDVQISGLTLRHSSKSVANNYAVYVHDNSNLKLLGCDISSRTGCGVGIEGSDPLLVACRIHDCARCGVGVFGPLDPYSQPPGGGVIQECEIHSNAGDGILVRGSAPDVIECLVHDNRGFGVSLQDSYGTLQKNNVVNNARGNFHAEASFNILDNDMPRFVQPTDAFR